MFDVVLQIGASKLLVSAVLAGVVWVVQRRAGHPAFAHRLWLLVLIALLLPAVASIPVLPGAGGSTVVISADAVLVGETVAGVPAGVASDDGAGPGAPLPARITEDGKAGLAIVWLAVTALLLGWTLFRTLRFRRWLARTSQPAPVTLHDEVAEIGGRLDLTRMPEVRTTTARVSPMVCWTGGRVRLVIPSFLLASLDRQQLRAVLAHELAHVHRRDHLVRWIEWLACSAFWWNPVAWWARRELRAAEEASCDALGVAATRSTPRAYAKSLIRVVELLSTPPTPPAPAFASAASSGSDPKALERRLKVLISTESTIQAPRWLRVVGATATVCILPLGLIYCDVTDEATPTALEAPPELAGQTDEAAGKESAESKPLSWNLELPFPVPSVDTMFTYYIASASGTSGPHIVTNHARLPSGCSWVFEPRWEGNWEELLKICGDTLAEALKAEAGSEPGAVCVGRKKPEGAWSAHCQLWAGSDGASELTAGQVWRLQESVLAGPPLTG